MSLTDRAIRAAKPGDSAYRLSDGRGLCLRVYPTGRKAFEFRYRIDGRQRTADLGDFGDGAGLRTLEGARSEAQRLRDAVRTGADPRPRKGALTSGKFEDVADSWYRSAIEGEY